MDYLMQLTGNRILIAGLISWAIAQVFKAINNVIITGEFSLERLFGDGGMPSGHSATVSAVMLSVGFECGFDSPIFAVAAILAIIVMHDAMNVRLESGKQAHLLNIMTEHMEKLTGKDLNNDEKLKELLGHTPTQVGAGCALGLVVAMIFHLVF